MARGVMERFTEKYIPITESGCWIWTANTHKQGYGKLNVNGKQEPAHRTAYKLYKGEIPENMMVCHSCDIPECVNPDHLFLGTALDNMRDKISKGRHRGAKGGESHHNSKLNKKDVIEIRKSKKYQYELAEIYNVSQSQISNIKRGARWHAE